MSNKGEIGRWGWHGSRKSKIASAQIRKGCRKKKVVPHRVITPTVTLLSLSTLRFERGSKKGSPERWNRQKKLGKSGESIRNLRVEKRGDAPNRNAAERRGKSSLKEVRG